MKPKFTHLTLKFVYQIFMKWPKYVNLQLGVGLYSLSERKRQQREGNLLSKTRFIIKHVQTLNRWRPQITNGLVRISYTA